MTLRAIFFSSLFRKLCFWKLIFCLTLFFQNLGAGRFLFSELFFHPFRNLRVSFPFLKTQVPFFFFKTRVFSLFQNLVFFLLFFKIWVFPPLSETSFFFRVSNIQFSLSSFWNWNFLLSVSKFGLFLFCSKLVFFFVHRSEFRTTFWRTEKEFWKWEKTTEFWKRGNEPNCGNEGEKY